MCAGVSFAELDEAVAGDRNASVESLGAALGCGVQCGSCLPASSLACRIEARPLGRPWILNGRGADFGLVADVK